MGVLVGKGGLYGTVSKNILFILFLMIFFLTFCTLSLELLHAELPN
jgi:hypothetical protein